MKTYKPQEVIVAFKGVRLTGYMDGTFVEVKRDEESFMKHTGSDGAVTRSQNNNKGGSVTLTLVQSAASNDVLSAFQLADENSGDKDGSLIIKDNSGRTLCKAGTAWIKKPVDVDFGKEVAGRQWEFDCAKLDIYAGGN